MSRTRNRHKRYLYFPSFISAYLLWSAESVRETYGRFPFPSIIGRSKIRQVQMNAYGAEVDAEIERDQEGIKSVRPYIHLSATKSRDRQRARRTFHQQS